MQRAAQISGSNRGGGESSHLSVGRIFVLHRTCEVGLVCLCADQRVLMEIRADFVSTRARIFCAIAGWPLVGDTPAQAFRRVIPHHDQDVVVGEGALADVSLRRVEDDAHVIGQVGECMLARRQNGLRYDAAIDEQHI